MDGSDVILAEALRSKGMAMTTIRAAVQVARQRDTASGGAGVPRGFFPHGA
jgi:hypothetical protein